MASLYRSLSNGFIREALSPAAESQIANVTGAPVAGILLGSYCDYTQVGYHDAGEVQYVRVYIPGGTAIGKIVYYQASGGDAARYVRMGLYTQTSPTDETGLPSTKAAETASIPTNGLNSQFVEVSLTSTYVTPQDGYYWIAFITNSNDLQFAMSEMFGPDFLPVRRGPSAGSTLPASPGIVVNPSSATVLTMALEA